MPIDSTPELEIFNSKNEVIASDFSELMSATLKAVLNQTEKTIDRKIREVVEPINEIQKNAENQGRIIESLLKRQEEIEISSIEAFEILKVRLEKIEEEQKAFKDDIKSIRETTIEHKNLERLEKTIVDKVISEVNKQKTNDTLTEQEFRVKEVEKIENLLLEPQSKKLISFIEKRVDSKFDESILSEERLRDINGPVGQLLVKSMEDNNKLLNDRTQNLKGEIMSEIKQLHEEITSSKESIETANKKASKRKSEIRAMRDILTELTSMIEQSEDQTEEVPAPNITATNSRRRAADDLIESIKQSQKRNGGQDIMLSSLIEPVGKVGNDRQGPTVMLSDILEPGQGANLILRRTVPSSSKKKRNQDFNSSNSTSKRRL